MEEHLRTLFTQRGLTITGADGGDREVDLISGAMHYWRIAPADWKPCLRAMKKLGLGIVETYVPWGVHEQDDRSIDWSKELDLGAFLDAVAAAGMLAIVRPGPHINAELTLFGFPERILRDRAMLAVTARGTPAWMPAPPRMFPVPSYASAAFRREVTTWMAAVGAIVGPRLAPDGPVIAAQVDNESQMFFRLGAFDHDYHPDAIAWWRQFAPDSGEPPRSWDPDDAGRCARWVAFKDEYSRRSLGWIADEMRAAGISGVALFHNVPPSDPALIDLTGGAAAVGGIAGMDFYHLATDYDAYRRRSLYVTGSAEPLPYAPEVGVGGPPWLPPMSERDQQSVTLGLLSSGVRALNLYMAVDRDRWYGAAISADGAPLEPAAWLRTLLSVLDDAGWTSLRRDTPVALIVSRADARYAIASSPADPLTPVLGEFLGLGPAGFAELSTDEQALGQRRWFAAIEEALSLAQVPYHLVDENCPVEALQRYRVVILPTLNRVDRAAWRRLKQLTGTRVILGPHKPTVDEYGAPLGEDAGLPHGAGLIREDSAADIDSLADDLIAVAGDLPERWITAEQTSVDCSLFADTEGVERILFTANRCDDDVVADVLVPSGVELSDPFADRSHASNDGIALVPLAPYEVKLLFVERTG